MSKFQNYLNFLQPEYQLISSAEEFKNNILIFECEKKHQTKLSVNAFGNKKCKVDKGDLCTECKIEHDEKIKFDNLQNEILESTGHFLLELGKDRKVKYVCGNCLEEAETFIQNLRKNTGYCGRCSNEKNKLSYQKIKEIIEKEGFVLVDNFEDVYQNYKNNKQKIKVICPCKRECEMVLFDIKRGRKCGGCKGERTIQTCLEKYNVDNPSKAEEVKEKIKETNRTRLGVDYPQQNEEVRKKTEETVLEKYNKRWAFCQDYVYEKIKETCNKNYGVNYPLQCKNIQEKIEKNIFGEI